MKERIVLLKNRLFAIRFLRFFLSGGLAFLVDTGVLIIVKAVFFNGVDYKVLGTFSVAKLISGSFGIMVMFTLNRFWVFSESRGVSLRKQSARYLLVTVLNLIFASLLFPIFASLLSQVFTSDYLLHISLFLILTNLLTEGSKMIISFFAYKYLVFR
ncbi:MAG: GtrA family protein [Candidatus Dojkabacteria bacterium]